MLTTRLRKVGGSVMLAIPPALLDVAELGVGMEVGLTLEGGNIVIQLKKKRAYSLSDLSGECDLSQPAGNTEWVEAPATGEEWL